MLLQSRRVDWGLRLPITCVSIDGLRVVARARVGEISSFA